MTFFVVLVEFQLPNDHASGCDNEEQIAKCSTDSTLNFQNSIWFCKIYVKQKRDWMGVSNLFIVFSPFIQVYNTEDKSF